MSISRRSLLLGGIAGGAGLLAGCGDEEGVSAPAGPRSSGTPTPIVGSDVLTPTRYPYGDDPSQWADLYRPAPGTTWENEPSLGVVVVIHGGYWRAPYDATLGAPLALSLAENGWTAWNLEYRRVGEEPDEEGGGGGFPATFDDVAAGIDALAGIELTDAERASVITLGHSAGGHLAVWAAGRTRFDRWSGDADAPAVPLTAAISQAGILDFGAALEHSVARSNVIDLMGGDDDRDSTAYAEADPLQQVPLDVPVRCVHGGGDQVVPLSQSQAYVEAATAAGGDVALTEIDGDHFTVIDTASDAWFATLDLLQQLRTT